MARAGAINMPSTRKSTASTSQSTSLTAGFTPRRANPSVSPTQIEAAPSVSGDELPAVIEPLA
jgi:hypothetical protein